MRQKTSSLPWRRWLVRMVAGGCFATLLSPAYGKTTTTDEVKAGFLLNFAKFVEWPADASPNGASPLVFGVFGDDFLGRALYDTVRGKLITARALTVKGVTINDDLTHLHVLFIGTSDRDRVADVIKRLDGTSVLTVSDLDHFCHMGGVIGFAIENNRVRFEINLDAAERAHLTLSSKLLTLAKKVYSTKEPGGHR